jgi:hypothetical protein
MAGIEFGKDQDEKNVDRLEQKFWELTKDDMKEAPAPFVANGVASEDHWTWKMALAKGEHRLASFYGLDAEQAPECCVEKASNGRIIGWNVVKHFERDEWEFRVDQMGPSLMDYDRIAAEFEERDTSGVREKVSPVSGAIYFNHLPGGYREFPNKKAAAAWFRANMPDTELK